MHSQYPHCESISIRNQKDEVGEKIYMKYRIEGGGRDEVKNPDELNYNFSNIITFQLAFHFCQPDRSAVGPSSNGASCKITVK